MQDIAFEILFCEKKKKERWTKEKYERIYTDETEKKNLQRSTEYLNNRPIECGTRAFVFVS